MLPKAKMAIFSKKTILITGANGFIGKNLISHLSEIESFELLSFTRGGSIHELESYLSKADCIVHLAGECRPTDDADYEFTNVQLTKKICEYASKQQKKIPIIFSSTVQVEKNNLYGKSKADAEEVIRTYSDQNGIPAFIFRLPGIFGKWAKPNHNSVVATFCFNIANDLPIIISNEATQLSLCYIDDIIELFIQSIISIDDQTECQEINVPGKYFTTLRDLSEKIYAFSYSPVNLSLYHVGSGFERALYATYTSYLPKSKFYYDLLPRVDERGSFTEVLKTIDSGQISFIRIRPGYSRGKHFHHTKIEKFIVVSGISKFKFRDILTDERFEIEVDSSSESRVVETIPGWAHEIINIGQTDLVVLIWSSEVFNLSKPDTIASSV
jgi:UDP-2-acetamido-2,6-beta-L-arabino-hexul-4-ose reductase